MSPEELKLFVEGQPEAQLFYIEAPENLKQLTEDISKLSINQLNEAMKNKNVEIKYKPCKYKCKGKVHPYGSLRYCSTIIQDLIMKQNVCNHCLMPGHSTNLCVGSHLSWNCGRYPGLTIYYKTMVDLCKKDGSSRVLQMAIHEKTKRKKKMSKERMGPVNETSTSKTEKMCFESLRTRNSWNWSTWHRILKIV